MTRAASSTPDPDETYLGFGVRCVCSPETRTSRSGVECIAVGRRIDLNEVHELSPGKNRAIRNPGSIKFAFHPTARARYLVLPGLKADQEICINSRSTKGR